MYPVTMQIVYENQKVLEEIKAQNPEYRLVKRKRIDKDSLIATFKYRVPEGWKPLTEAAKVFCITVPRLKYYLKEEGLMEPDNLPSVTSYDDDYVLALKAEKTRYGQGPTTVFYWDTEKLKRFIPIPTIVDELTAIENFLDFTNKFVDFIRIHCDKIGHDKVSAQCLLGLAGELIEDVGCNMGMELFELGYTHCDFYEANKSKKTQKKFYEEKMAGPLDEMLVMIEKYIPEDLENAKEICKRFRTYGLENKRPWRTMLN